jgi:hypothetical protein
MYFYEKAQCRAKERRMSDWLFKSWLKISALTVILFFFYHLFISQKLEEEHFSSDNDN